MNKFTQIQLQKFGLQESQLQEVQQQGRSFLLQAQAFQAFRQLQEDAEKAGFDLSLVSAFRGFQRQQLIWQAKAKGERALMDSHGQPLEAGQLSEWQRLLAIMRWSAIPGLSRHHWGTDMDIFDAHAMPCSAVQLLPQEVADKGPFGPLHQWLDERIAMNQSYGFYRPYHGDFNGVAEERWHLSFLPQAKLYMAAVDKEALLALWQAEDISFLPLLVEHFDSLYKRFVELPLQGQPEWVLQMLEADV